ncbi:MAG: hypothetical protein A7315_14325 [Candidatus Altiarchaeales archaeon WOR_SM1_79]|nr:MAG: hypothetical protein A7315_14325 [Candidatus Altiarchaeales archaeon WOR_SM1_79]
MAEKIKLSRENRSKCKRILKKEIKTLSDKLKKEIGGGIKNQIETDKNEIKDISIIVCAFDNEKSPFDYIRTEPLFFFKEKNFDVLLYGKNTIVLIDVKEFLTTNILAKISNHKKYCEMVNGNIEITNTIDDKKMKILDYFQSVVNDKISGKEFVMATQKPHTQLVISKAKEAKHNFCLWNLLEKENKIFIINEVIQGDEDIEFFGHRDRDLGRYLKKLSNKGEVYNDPLTFINSSSRYLKSINISIPLFNLAKNGFNYEQWCEIFKTDLMNWHEEEKQIVYKNYIEYGINCNFIKCIDDKDDIFINTYSIISRYSKTDLLENNILSKIVGFEVNKRIEEYKPKLEKQIKSELLTEQSKEKGYLSLTDFT